MVAEMLDPLVLWALESNILSSSLITQELYDRRQSVPVHYTSLSLLAKWAQEQYQPNNIAMGNSCSGNLA